MITRIESQRKKRWVNSGAATWTWLVVIGCSSAPIPSAEERQVDDVAAAVRPADPPARSPRPASPRTASSPAATTTAAAPSSAATAQVVGIDGGSDAGGGSGDAGPGCDAGCDADDDTTSATSAVRDAGNLLDGGPDANPSLVSDAGESLDGATEAGPAKDERLPLGTELCPPTLLDGVHYAEGPEFWLGDQSESLLRVNGYGYFASREPEAWEPAHRFSTKMALSVRPDGTLEDHEGYEVLGYDVSPDASACLTTFRAPINLPAKATSTVSVTMNLDSRAVVNEEPFDVSKPASTAIAPPITVPCVDGAGEPRSLLLYFECTAPGSYRYHVLIPSRELGAATDGLDELGWGDIEFDAAGVLLSENSPETCFPDALGQTCLEFDFGTAFFEAGTSDSEASTSLPSATAMNGLHSDGYLEGTSTRVTVDSRGVVNVEFDNGKAIPIGVLAIARFPNEDQLFALDGSAYAQSTASGVPAFAPPGSRGRGTVLR